MYYAKYYSSSQKVFIFFLVLPFGQFVPFLSWVDSFDFPCFKAFFEVFNLKAKDTAYEQSMTREYEETGGDMLFDFIRKKFYSHGGFLIEALAEAIPQSILQTIAVLYFGEASLLFIVSIFVSICVISSKGYLVSYSMHRPTFVFNMLCVFADVLCLFATVCWLFSSDDEEDPMFNFEDGVKLTWFVLFGSSCALMVLSSGCFIFFGIFNEHHDRGLSSQHKYASLEGLLLELYVCTILSWLFALVPMAVSLLTFKFIFFPISCQNHDLCADFAKYRTFYSELHNFLSKGGMKDKLHLTNRFFLCKMYSVAV